MPKHMAEKFKCPHCGILSQQLWLNDELLSSGANSIVSRFYYDYRLRIASLKQDAVAEFMNNLAPVNVKELRNLIPSKLSIGNCLACKEVTLWVNGAIVYPKKSSMSLPNTDLNDDIKNLYMEAASIFNESPRGATALLRLCLQKLLKQIGKKGENINSDIKELVSEGLSPKIQQGLDLLRVVGNNAVHPGQIDLDDNSEVALKLFHIFNFIAEELISKPKELESLYAEIIPAETKEHIKQRDRNT